MKHRSFLIISLLLTASVVLFLFNPEISSFYPRCPLHKYTGLYCPGCGTQRAAHEILHGNIAQAFNLNALFTISIPIMLYYFFIELFNRLAKTNIKNIPITTKSITFFIVLAMTFMILRNLDFPPFNCLAP